MSAELSWYDNDKRSVILCAFSGKFDVDNYAVLEGQLPMMIREVDHLVDVIACLNSGASLPNPRGILRELGILINVMPDNCGLLVGVGYGWFLTNPISIAFVRAFLPIYDKHMSQHIAVANSVESAARLIEKYRMSNLTNA